MEKDIKDRIIIAALKTWDAIGGDVLTCMEECGEDPVMPREHVIETVLDAGYMNMYGEDKEAYQVLQKMDYDDQFKLLKEAFKAPRYGW